MPPNKPKRADRAGIYINMPPDLHAAIKARAQSEMRTIAAQTIVILRDALLDAAAQPQEGDSHGFNPV